MLFARKKCFTTLGRTTLLLCRNRSLSRRLGRFCSCSRRGRRRDTAFLPSPQVYFALADDLAGLLPAFGALSPSLLSQLGERGPVHAVVVLEVDFAAGVLHELRGGDVVGEGLVVAHLGLCDRVDEGRDELEEGGDVPGHWR